MKQQRDNIGFALGNNHFIKQWKLYYSDYSENYLASFFYFQSVSLFSYVGGYLGLWLGISLVAICDVLETAVLVIRWTIRKCSKRRRFKNRVHSRQRMVFDDPSGQMWFLWCFRQTKIFMTMLIFYVQQRKYLQSNFVILGSPMVFIILQSESNFCNDII